MERVHVIADPAEGEAEAATFSRAWLFDPESFHREFDELFEQVDHAEGLARLRWMATQIWRSSDPGTRAYIGLLRTDSADDWEAEYDESHLGDWYRVLMATHLQAAPAVPNPRALRDGLTELGWTPTEARRLAYGRELTSMVETYGSPAVAGQISPQLMLGSRGWLSAEDVGRGLERLRGLDPVVFRDAQPLVPLVEQLYAMLVVAEVRPDRVLLVLGG